jgi:hypothetical protein
MNVEKYYPGKGCKCHAYGENECACGVDWTDPEVYELRKWKEAIIEELMSIGIYTEEWASDPEKALHNIICWHTEAGIHLAEEERWHKSFKKKWIGLWYSTPFPYWFYKIGKIQPPF